MNDPVAAASPEQAHSPASARQSRFVISSWCAIWLAAAAVATAYIYYTIFSLFQGYDDEGFILISLKAFFQGKPLYDEIYSSFQPGFYVLYWLLFKLSATMLCHDSIRLITLVFWLTAAGLNGLTSYRLTASPLLALLVFISSVRCLEPFANEPGHPQAVAYVLVAAVVLLFTFTDTLAPRSLALAIGALVGLVLLLKINVGAFLILPVVLIVASRRSGSVALWIKIVVCALMVILPSLLWRTQLSAKGVPLWSLAVVELLAALVLLSRVIQWRGWPWLLGMGFAGGVVTLALTSSTSAAALPVFSASLLTLSICAAVVMCFPYGDNEHSKNIAWLRLLIGGAIMIGLILLTVQLRGTTFHGLMNGLFWWPAKVSSSFLIRLRSNWLGACFGLLGVAACSAFFLLRDSCAHRAWFGALIRVAQLSFGVAVLAEFYLRMPGSSTLMPLQINLPHFWMLPFAWLVAVPEAGERRTNLARQALLAITVMQPLIAVPVAGTQLVPASIMICVLGAVCLAIGFRGSWVETALRRHRQLLRLATGALAALLLVPFARETLGLSQYYSSLTLFDLPGATRIRISRDEVRLYHQLVAELARPEVETFLTLPGMNSLYLWAGKEPPNSLNVSAWVLLLDDKAQETIWQAAAKHSGLRVVRNKRLLRSWVGGRSVAQLPLVRHIEENFIVATNYGSYELLVRR